MDSEKIPLIAITGGPCGGKSTFLAKAVGWLQNYGISTIIVAETATEFFNANVHQKDLDNVDFQKELIGHQLEKENRFISIARLKKRPTVILCDRGILDCAAYLGYREFVNILYGMEIIRSNAMNRYDGVIHLVTAADGAKDFYTLENNKARSESPRKAIELDNKTQRAWLGHPHHLIIDNSTGFEGKILRALKALSSVLGIPEPTEIERKFKILNFHPSLIPSDSIPLEIIQDYLISRNDIERRLRILELYGEKTFFYTEKSETGKTGVRNERERIITENDYYRLFAQVDTNLETIQKTRHCFVYAGHKFELDVYKSPDTMKEKASLEVELVDINEPVELPPQFQLEEVTGKKGYSNYDIAMGIEE